jgi:putative membrane protein
MKNFFLKILLGILTIFLATKFIPGVRLEAKDKLTEWKSILFIGAILGILNIFLKPILKILTLPISFLTLGLFSFIINLALVEILDILFLELKIEGLKPLFLTSLLVWVGEFLANFLK